MEPLLFIAKSAAILSIFYGVYFLFLRKDTLFTAKRHFFLSGIVAALLLPFIEYTKTIYIDPPIIEPIDIDTLISMAPTEVINQVPEPIQTPIDWWQVALAIYIIGVLVLSIRFIVQSLSLVSMLKGYQSEKKNGYHYIKVNDTVSPFSIFKYIVYNPDLHTEEELQMILKHEQAHASQWHSIDIIFGQIITILQWVNPFSWIYKKGMEANLEYMADSHTVTQVASKKQYQLTLVKASSPLVAPALTSPFYQSLIKKRIIMLNKSTSNKRNLIKVSLVLPLLALFMLSFNVKENFAYKTDLEIVEPELIITSESLNDELIEIENKLNEASPAFEVDLKDVKRDAANKLTKLVIATKFKEQSRFHEIITYGGTNKSITPIKLEAFENLLEINDLENGMVILNTAKGTTSQKLRKEENTALGENPLYIINNTEYRKEDIPEGITLKNDSNIVHYSKSEGLKKYGTKGKDGVLVFKGNTVFAKNNTTALFSKAAETAVFKISNGDFEYKITKNTTDEELQAIKNELKEQGANFDYNVTRNNEGEITGIKFSYDDNKGNNTSYNVSNDAPIKPIYFYSNEKGMGVGNPKNNEGLKEIMKEHKMLREEARLNRAEAMARREAQKLARKEMRLAQSNRMRSLEEAEIKRAEAMENRSEHMARREAEMVLRKKEMKEHMKEMKEQMKERRHEIKEKMRKRHSEAKYRKVKKHLKKLKDGHSETIIHLEKDGNPVYIVDGKHISIADLEDVGELDLNVDLEHLKELDLNIDLDDIESIRVLGNRNIAIIDDNDRILHLGRNHHSRADIHITKNTSDAKLEVIKSRLKKEGMDVSFKRVKRNSLGQLTRIKVQITGNGVNQTSYSKNDNNTPIEDMHISF